jgi:hypothetical protein
MVRRGGHELAGEGAGDVRGQRLGERIFLFLFFIGLTSGPLSMSAHMEFSSPAQHLHVGPTHQIQCQFTLNSRSVRITKKYLKSRGFLRLKRKVVVFRN